MWCHYLHLQRAADQGQAKLIATVPADPVPGRRLLIIRDDTVPTPRSAGAGPALSFDALLAANSDPSTYQKYSSLEHSLSRSSTVVERHPSAARERDRESSPAPPPATKRWTMLKNMLPFTGGAGSSSTGGKPGPLTLDTKVGGGAASPAKGPSPTKPRAGSGGSPDSAGDPDTPAAAAAAKPGSFKFSLEWAERPGGAPAPSSSSARPGPRKLAPPRLPHTSQALLRHLAAADDDGRPRYAPRRPAGVDVGPSKYSGRALAEWWLLLLECQNFYERRKAEGVVGLRAVEVPVLTVENFRKPIG